MLTEWWKGHKWEVMPLDMLPPTGFIVGNICAGFIYKTDGKLNMFEWVVSDPTSSKEDRAQALDILIDAVLEESQRDGAKIVFTSVQHPRLIERYKKQGFVVGDEGMTNLVRMY